jgi:CO/xanthine dehydrogenase FAD-binding subunit
LTPVDVLTPRTLEEALRLKAERPAAVPIQGGTDLMVDLNFDRSRPGALLNLNEVPELRGWSRDGDTVWLGAGLTYVEAMEPRLAEALPALAEAARTVGGPQIRNRGTIGGNLGTSSPAGDALPPLLVCGAKVKLASVGGEREVALPEFVVGPKRNVLAEDELILGVSVDATESRQTFMKVGPRNAMVIAVVSLAVRVDGELRAAFGSAGPVPTLVRAELGDVDSFPQRVAEAASPIDDVRGSAAYRRHALRILTRRALDRCLV